MGTHGRPAVWLLLAWVGGLLLWFSWSSYESFNTPKEALFSAGMALLGAAVFLRWLRERAVRLPWSPLIALALLFWGWGWLPVFVATPQSMVIRAQLFALHSLLLLILVPLVVRPCDFERLWTGVAVIGGVVAVIALGQWFGLNYEHGVRWLPRQALASKVEIYSTIGNPNYLAAVLAFLLPVMLALAAGRMGQGHADVGAARTVWRRVVLSGSCVVIAAVALLLTRSKGGMAATFVGLSVLWWLWGRLHGWSWKKRMASGAGGAGLVCGLLLLLMWQAPSMGMEWTKLLRLSGDDPSVKGRLLMWETTLEMVKAHPIIGIGTGAFGFQYQFYRALVYDRLDDAAAVYPASEHSYDEAGSAHNDWLQLAAENGLVGFILFIGLVFYCIVGGIRLLHRQAATRSNAAITLPAPSPGTLNPVPAYLLCGLIAGISAVLAHALVDFPFHQPVVILLFWLGLATLVAAGASRAEWPLPSWLASKAVRWGMGGAVVMGAGLLLVHAARPLMAGVYQREAWVLMQGRQWAAALPVIRKGLEWDPLQPELTLYSGVARYELGDLEGSRLAYERYQLLYSDFQTLYNLGLIAVRQRRWGEAEGYFRKALRYKPTLAQAAVALALVAEQTGRPDEARRYRQRAEQLRHAGA